MTSILQPAPLQPPPLAREQLDHLMLLDSLQELKHSSSERAQV